MNAEFYVLRIKKSDKCNILIIKTIFWVNSWFLISILVIRAKMYDLEWILYDFKNTDEFFGNLIDLKKCENHKAVEYF